MILQALKQYYDRLASEDEPKVPLQGFSNENIDFAIIFDRRGNCVDVNDLRVQDGKKMRSRKMIVPQAIKRSGKNPPANFLWDNTGYVLGADNKGKPDNAIQAFKNFKEHIAEIMGASHDEGIKGVRNFLENWNPENAEQLKYWNEMIGKKIVFRLDGDRQFVHERPAVRKAWLEYSQGRKAEHTANCLITGKFSSIARLHPSIKGVSGTLNSVGDIVSFNKDSFISYGKSQSFNAPISEEAAFEYTAALNHLLLRDSERKIQIGDATTVFWAEKDTPLESWLAQIFKPQEEDTGAVSEVRNFLQAVRNGVKPGNIDTQTKFYVLGLSPSMKRISVRFWYAGTVGELSERIGKHFRDIAIEKHSEKDRNFPGMWQLLIQTAIQRKTDNINPLLSGELIRSILTGGNYPESMLSALIERIRAGEEINYLRVAMIKGILTRNHKKEVSMSWDKSRKDTAYLLGGLFAILEKTQKDAGNETIREKYFRSASATPKLAFSVLMPLAQHHIAKADFGFEDDKRIAEVMDDIKEFPSYLRLQEQGLFSIGYYHMRNRIWKEIMDASEAKKAKSNK
jgi:CRISPR-associated protein Csd1